MNFLIEKNINKKVWDIYLNNNVQQEISSQGTARIQKPRTLKMIQNMELKKDLLLLDIGCGIGNEIFGKELKKLNIDYNGCDPFNRTQEDNLKSILKCANGKADIVTLNNVLNTIPEENVWVDILKQAKDAMNKESGILMTLIYEGEKNSKEKKQEKETGKKIELTPIKTRDGWQNRMKTEKYLEAVQKVFRNSKVIKTDAGKVVLSSLNYEIELENIIKKKVKKPKII